MILRKGTGSGWVQALSHDCSNCGWTLKELYQVALVVNNLPGRTFSEDVTCFIVEDWGVLAEDRYRKEAGEFTRVVLALHVEFVSQR